MASAPVSIKLRCSSWKQLMAIYRRDLLRSALFLKAKNPPPVGTGIKIKLMLPSDSLVVLDGAVAEHVPPGGLDGRGPGIDIALAAVPQSAMWLIETALASAAGTPQKAAARPPPPAPAASEASVDEGREVVDAESELVAALEQELESLQKLNPFQVLGVGYDTHDEAVRAAFGQLTKRYHPDRYARFESDTARELAAEIFILIRDAYRRLGNAEARRRTLEVLHQKRAEKQRAAARERGARRRQPPTRPPPAPSPAAQPPPSQDKNPDADALIDAGKYTEAIAIYSLIARKNPDDRTARAGVELGHGLKALAESDRLEAAQRFEAVLELDPANERAARELADMRRQATNERKGLLSRLLGKKE